MLMHILKHAWLWPLMFFLRPFDIPERIKADENLIRAEVWSAIFGGVLWGSTIGILLWLTESTNIHAIWILPSTFAVTFIGVLNIAFGLSNAIGFTVLLIGILSSSITSIIFDIQTGMIAVTLSLSSIFIFSKFNLVSTLGLIYLVATVVSIDIILAFWPQESTIIFLLITSNLITLTLLSKIYFSASIKKITVTWFFICLVSSQFLIFNLLEFSSKEPHLITTFSLIIGLGFGFIAPIIRIIIVNETKTNTQLVQPISWRTFFFISILMLAFWLSPWEPENFQHQVQIISLSLLVISLLFSGLMFYPILAIWSFWQFSPKKLAKHKNHFPTSLPFQYQTFSCPLPRLVGYLQKLAHQSMGDFSSALVLLQSRSFQGTAASHAADRVLNSSLALRFAGFIANYYSVQTLSSISYSSDAARCLLVLQPMVIDQKKKEKIEIYIYNLRNDLSETRDKLNTQRQQSLDERIICSQNYLRKTDPLKDKDSLFDFLFYLHKFFRVRNFHLLSHSIPKISLNNIGNVEWLQPGYDLLQKLQLHCQSHIDYPTSASAELRKSVLRSYQEKLARLNWNFSDYWQHIANELVEHWQAVYQKEIDNIHDWLELETALINPFTRQGQQVIQLAIHNRSRVVGQNLQVYLDEAEGIHWQSRQFAVSGLIDIKGKANLSMPALITTDGQLVINGVLKAQDLDKREYQWPINLELQVNATNKAYEVADKNYYIAGPRLNDKQHFVGRKQLQRALKNLWQQPEEKQALLLIGLRRMGKSSLLETVRREGLGDHLVPVYADLQGAQSTLSFYHGVVADCCARLHIPTIELDRQDLHFAFKQFVTKLKHDHLQGRYILLMVDEANYFADPSHDYSGVPEQLRALMQDPNQPILLLFCGTHELRRGASDYQSVLFNTCHTEYVSYMPEQEAHEVLTRPVKDVLEYDPQALALAFQLTAGHPYLLQLLGYKLVEQFDQTVLSGKNRSNYVTYSDMEMAGTTLSELNDNAAFGNYWEDAQLEQHLVLSVMAYYLDELNRKVISLEGILAEAGQFGLTLNRAKTHQTLIHFLQQDLLVRYEDHYAFRIPLFRRWVNWHYPIKDLRESTD